MPSDGAFLQALKNPISEADLILGIALLFPRQDGCCCESP
jgi:hypothetical protein